jgi:hypothetical protein
MTISKQRSFLLLASFALSAVLVVLLIRLGKIDLRATQQQLEGVRAISLIKVMLLNILIVITSAEKWRSIDATLRRSSDAVQSRIVSFALTSAGLALGTVLPVQLALSTVRMLGTYVHGSALKRGAAGTLVEQGFDVLTVGFLAIASGITLVLKGAGPTWAIIATAMIVLALLLIGPSVRLIRWLAMAGTAREISLASWFGTFLHRVVNLVNSDFVHIRLARRLVILSTARFIVVVLMSIETAKAVGLHIPLWHMAAAIPFVVFASVIALTPGGLGINELAGTAALTLFGTSVSVGAQWALANRILVTLSYFAVTLCAATVVFVAQMMPYRQPRAM